MAFRKVWSVLLELARFVWETRETFRRPGEASRGRALKTREDRKKREFLGGARRKAREPQEPQEALWQTEITGEAWRVAARRGKDPHRNASSRFLRRVAQRSPWGPGGALRRGALGPFGIAVMRFEALGFARFPKPPRPVSYTHLRAHETQ